MDTSGAGDNEVSLISVETPQASLSESVDSEAAGKVCDILLQGSSVGWT